LSGNRQALFGVSKNSFNLFPSYTGEPLEEVINTGAIFEICEKSLDGNPRADEDPGSTDFVRDPFNRGACAPIKHEKG
jgi:hypothetical protein